MKKKIDTIWIATLWIWAFLVWLPIFMVGCGGIPKPSLTLDMFNKVKKEYNTRLSGIETGIENMNLNAQVELGRLEAKVVGYDKSMKQEFKAGRDVTSKVSTNDPKIFYIIITSLCGIIIFLLKANFATRKWLLNALNSNKEKREKIKELEKNGGGKDA